MSDDARRLRWTVRLGAAALRLLASTWRVRAVNDGPLNEARRTGQPVLFALWHGELLPLLWHQRGRGVAVVISEHRDGEIIAQIAESLGYRTVRGSSSRGASRALLGLTREMEQGHDGAITPDGPRGRRASSPPVRRWRRSAPGCRSFPFAPAHLAPGD
jgi:lysophospholipid acyltransferase (LPLAT)-like uncharacterized protein